MTKFEIVENDEITTQIVSKKDNKSWTKFTDCTVFIYQAGHVVVLTQKELEALEKVIGGKFRI